MDDLDPMDYVMQHQESSPPQAQQPHQPHPPHQPHHQQPQQQQQQPHLQQQHQQPQQQQPQRQCPYWQDHHHPSPPQPYGINLGPASPGGRSQPPHPYDPVHSSIPVLSNWFPPPQAFPYQWTGVTLPHPRASGPDVFYPYPGSSNNAAAGNTSSSGNTSNSRGVGGSASLTTSGPVQPSVVQNQQTPRHEPFTPFPVTFHNHQSAGVHRFGALPPQNSSPNHNHQTGQQNSHQSLSFGSVSADLSSAPRQPVFSFPPLNTPAVYRPGRSSQQQPQQYGGTSNSSGSAMSSSEDSSDPGSSAGLPSRPPFIPTTGSMLSGLPEPSRSRNVISAEGQSQRTPDLAATAVAATDSDGTSGPTSPAVQPNPERRRIANTRPRQPPTRRSPDSDYDSDEEAAEAADAAADAAEDQQTMQFLDQLAAVQGAPPGAYRSEDMTETRIRAHQILRGQISTKRVASKTALQSLQCVEISSLPETEKTCIICYNEFGVANPEGAIEAPLRLPKCKHVFGDHCIKKWFEESDSCPYCRDKVPSEPQVRAGTQALREYFGRTVPRTSGYRTLLQENGGSANFAFLREATASEVLARYVRPDGSGVQLDVSPSRTWQTGERRSPPSEASENRRRMRPRHGSFRGSQSSNGVTSNNNRPSSYAGVTPSATPHQQSPGRERVNPPNLPPHWFPLSHDPRRPLTQFTPRQYPSSSHRPHAYSTSNNTNNANNNIGTYQRPITMPMFPEPLGLNPPSMPALQHYQNYMPPPIFASSSLSNPNLQEQQANPNPPSGASGQPPAEPLRQPFSGPVAMPNYPQPVPAVGGADNPAYSTQIGGGQANASREAW